jgi:hypothetical protein
MTDIHASQDHGPGQAADHAAADHAAADGHGASGHGGGDHDGHGDEALGPVDVQMWSVGVLGVAVGLLVCLCFALATGVIA